jgi:hypothetical protein
MATYTENGALSNATTKSACLDFFACAGNHNDFSAQFWAAYKEDASLAIRILLWARDCRGGSGAKATFKAVLRQMAEKNMVLLQSLFPYIPEFGSWKDVFTTFPVPYDWMSMAVARRLKNEGEHSLLCKYIPRKGPWFGALREKMIMSQSEFRHYIVSRSATVEQEMCAQKWADINYSAVPSRAGMLYKNAFIKHDEVRYVDYISSVLKGEKKINASVLYPNELVARAENDRSEAYEAMWNALPDYMEGSTERILPICDTSGSMAGTPIEVSVGLGMYISERTQGPFKNMFMTFSAHPQLQKLSGTFLERMKQLNDADWGMITNLQRTFEEILKYALKNNVSEDQMPTKLLIISDMQFDEAVGYDGTNFEAIQEKYRNAGYHMPSIIFWNVRGVFTDTPITKDDKNVAIVSGYSPAILKSVLKGDAITPERVMHLTVDIPRYMIFG